MFELLNKTLELSSRLDDIHNAIKGIQDGALSFMALGSPKSVLDLGYTSTLIS